jgi:hypothetical protein
MAEAGKTNTVNIEEGSLSFWTKPDQLDFNDSKIYTLMQLNPTDGSILILKDSDNKIKFFHVYLGKGRTDVEYDVSKLDKNKKHMFAFTWSVVSKEATIYIDGKLRSTTRIKY